MSSRLEDVKAAIQAAVLAKDYTLAINLLVAYKLLAKCVGCVGDVEGGFHFTMTWGEDGELKISACKACVEEFALWFVSKSPNRHLFEAALRGGLYRDC